MSFVHPQALAFLEALKQGSAPPADIEGQRTWFSRLWRSMQPKVGATVTFEPRTIVAGGRSIECLVYRPTGSVGALPVILFCHGGGGITLSPEDFDPTSRILAHQVNAIVVVPRYRLAPEHPFPAPLEDCFAVYRWLVESGGKWDIDQERIAVAGDSAGGYLAAAIAQEARRQSIPQPAAQALIYPMLDMAGASPSRYDRAYFVSDEALKSTIALHIGNAVLDPRASPLREPDLAGIAPTLIITTDLDPLMDEGRAYAHRLRAAGVSASYFCYEGQVHGFFSFSGAMEEGKYCIAHISSWLRCNLHP
ncbi:MAG: alpha/beta hydrolase [Rhodospirillaceae bacterium]|nr:alpha/beta hydrolase [Rhodospirillaceae bacterium]